MFHRRVQAGGRMRLYLMRFSTLGHLHRAFASVSDSEWVVSCLVDPQSLRLRFLAPEDEGAELVRRVHELGGLRWCSRHAMGASPARQVS